ncbi:MAG: hypothetical protein Q9227_009265 [Pyrenula ochraceoflavens]
MAAEFIGYTVLVTLKHPPEAQVQGVVSDVAGQRLILQNGELYLGQWDNSGLIGAPATLWDGQRFPIYHIEALNIKDLDISPQQRHGSYSDRPNGAQSQENVHPAHQQNHVIPASESQPQLLPSSQNSSTQSFVDPAILSYSKPAITTRTASIDSRTTAKPPVASPVMIADNDQPFSPSPTRIVKRGRKSSTATATLTEPFNHMAIDEKDLSELNEENKIVPTHHGANENEVAPQIAGKKAKKGRRTQDIGAPANSQTAPGIIDIKDLSQSPMAAKKTAGKGKGWRQTPLVQEATPGKKKARHHRKALAEDPNGWASEEATDIQDMGEFDFAHNLSKFDKRRVFDDIRKNDSTADDERLVSFNRKHKPGTNGGRNLHYSENVLDPPQQNNLWKSEAGETEEEEPEANYSGSRSSRRGLSRSRRQNASRKGSGILSNSTAPAPKLVRGLSSLGGSPRPPPNRLGATSAASNTPGNPHRGSKSTGFFRLLTTNKILPAVSSFQMLAIESSCLSEFGVGEDILTENAGRGIAEAVFKVSRSSSTLGTPSVLVLIGNHKSGARSIAGARHLRNHGVRVTVCVLSGEREADLLEIVRRQLDMYRKSGGWIVKWDEYQTRVNSGAEQPPGVILESLLATHITFDLLRLDDQAVAFEMVKWANRIRKAAAEIAVLSVDIPFGIDPNSGDATLVDEAPLVLESSHVLCLGAPKGGLTEMLTKSQDVDPEFAVSVVDLGIPGAAWKKYGPSSRRRGGIDWGKEWVIDVKFNATVTT